MSYIDEKVAPIREDRLKACNVYGGGACGLKDKFGKCCLQGAQRGFGQGTICQLLPGGSMLGTIPDSVVIMHGSIGCGGTLQSQTTNVRARQVRAGDSNPKGMIWFSTNLNEQDVVSGGELKLEKAILEADRRFRPSAIFIVATCAPGIIGDDIDGVANRLQSQVSAKLLPVHCEGFKTKIMATAYDAVFHAISRNLLEGEEEVEPIVEDDLEIAREAIRRSKLVNLMNFSSMSPGEQSELTRLLNVLDLTVQVFPCYTHPERMCDATEAALTISACPTHDDYFLKHLQEKYGVPYVIGNMPIGIESTNEWLRNIARFFHLEDITESFIAQETSELEKALAPLRENLRGKKVMISSGEIRALSTAVLAQELGMDVVSVRPYHYDEFGEQALDRLTRNQGDVTVNVATVHPYETANIIEKTKPDVYLGHISDSVWAAKLGVPVVPIFHSAYTYMGYTGVFDVARRINRVLKNPSFNKHLRGNVKQPYYQNWFREDAFSFIKRGAADAD